MQRNVISSVDVLFCIFSLLDYILLSQLSKKSVTLIRDLCDRLQEKLLFIQYIYVMLPNLFVLYPFCPYG